MRSRTGSSQTGLKFLASMGFQEPSNITDFSTIPKGGEILMSFSKSFLKSRRKRMYIG